MGSFQQIKMKKACIYLSIILELLMMSSIQATTLTKAVDNCKPEKLSALPPQLQSICVTLLKRILESEYVRNERAYNNLDGPYDDLQKLMNGEGDPNHVFLRFGRSGI